MRAVMSILRRILRKTNTKIHKARQKSILFAVSSLLNGGRLGLTALGRSAIGPAKTKHNIKRIDRLLGNSKLHHELPEFFSALSHAVIRQGSRPLILVDWTNLEYGKSIAITAAVPLQGRAIPIYWEVHEARKLGNRKVHEGFLGSLAEILPRGCRPIFVTDAGFHNTWFELLTDYDWAWVGRIGHATIRTEGGARWTNRSELYRRAAHKAQDLGICEVASHNPMHHRVVLGKQYKRDPRRSKAPRRRTDRGRGHERTRQRNQEPWILVTSLLEEDANTIQSIYTKRMSIEECYRDTKSHRFGWSMEDARSSDVLRYTVLLLVASLAMLIVLLVGMVAEHLKQQYAFQANTIRKTRVLSLFYLGRQVLRQRHKKKVRIRDLLDALRTLQAKSHFAVFA
jgi:hypothetical protein